MFSKIRHIFWDWNGTLLDDVRASVNAINSLLAARHLAPLSIAEYRRIFGFPVANFYRAIGFELEQEDWHQLAVDFHRLFLADPSIRLHAHATATLHTLHAAGLGQSLLSASEASILKRMVSEYQVGDFFSQVCGIDNLYGNSKLALGHQLLTKLALPPTSILVIGDSLHDFEIATALGASCLLISHGHQSAARLRQSGAPLLESLRDLPHWLTTA